MAVEDFYKNAPLQEGYAYSTLDSIEIQRLTADVYYVETKFTRLGLTGTSSFPGNTYLYTMDSGDWKIFATMGHERNDDHRLPRPLLYEIRKILIAPTLQSQKYWVVQILIRCKEQRTQSNANS